jgi:threonine dehydrogenase-like Zn-dependent dehydrogenase
MAGQQKKQGSGEAEPPPAAALWYEGPGRAALRPVRRPRAEPGVAIVRTLWSGLSRGTERLVFRGRIPGSEYERMRAPMQEGEFPFPVKYGYSAVGLVEEGPPDWIGLNVFALQPHQTLFAAALSRLTEVPATVPARRATLASNMETALNALWDSGAGPGDRIVVVGGGLLGLLVTYLAARLPGADVAVVDIDPSRAGVVKTLGARFVTVGEASGAGIGDADVVFHASTTAAGLTTALGVAGLEATVVELSWYGDQFVAAPLGQAFHSRRLRLVSSQVGLVAASRRARWSHSRRIAKALDLLADERLDLLISHEIAFGELPERLPELLAAGASGLATAVRY